MFAGRGYAADVVTSCPEYLVVGEVNTITCTVNSTSISNADCYPSPDRIDFMFVSVSGSVRPLCSSGHPGSHCVTQATEETCFCADQSNELFKYQLNFVANKEYDGGHILCQICDISTQPLIKESSPSCSRIKLGMYYIVMKVCIFTEAQTLVSFQCLSMCLLILQPDVYEEHFCVFTAIY